MRFQGVPNAFQMVTGIIAFMEFKVIFSIGCAIERWYGIVLYNRQAFRTLQGGSGVLKGSTETSSESPQTLLIPS